MTSEKEKKKFKLPRLLWQRKPQTQIVKNKKGYRRKGRRVNQEE